MKADRNVHKVKSIDTVGVAGSTPVEPTILPLGLSGQIIEIPEEYDVVPAVRMTDGHPSFYRCLVRKTPLSSEKGVKRAKRARKTA